MMKQQKELARLVDSHQMGESISYTELTPKLVPLSCNKPNLIPNFGCGLMGKSSKNHQIFLSDFHPSLNVLTSNREGIGLSIWFPAHLDSNVTKI